MGDLHHRNNDLEKSFHIKLPRILEFYKNSSFSLKLRVRVFYSICIAAIFALTFLLVSSSYVQLTGSFNKLDLQIFLPIIILLLIFSVTLFLLFKGKYNIATHLFLISANFCVWYIMFFSRGEHVVAKLDTVVLILAIINSIPLFISKYKTTIIFFTAVNLAILLLFISIYQHEYGLSANIVVDYIADTAIALIFSGIVVYQIVRINHQTLKKVERDYEDKIQVEQELRKSKAIRKKVFESSSIPMIIMDIDRREFVDLNDAAIQSFGYDSRNDLLGKKPADVSPACQGDGKLSWVKAEEIIERVNEYGTMTVEWQFKRSDGSSWDAEIHLLAFEYEDQFFLQYSLIDITQRKKAKEALSESESRFRGIFEDAQVGIYQTTPDGRILQANPALLNILGYDDLESLSKRNLNENKYFLKKSRKEFINTIEKQGYLKDYKSEWLRKNGEKIIIRENARVVKDAQGNIKYYEGFVVDITEHEKVMKALAESEEKYREMAEILPVAIWEIDLKGICTYTNKVGFKIHGYSPEDLVRGINVLDLIIPEQRDYAKKRLMQRLKGDISPGDEYVALRKDGTTFPANIFTSVIYHDKKPVGFIGVTIDITEAKKAEQELEKYHKHLEFLVQERTEELATANEELTSTNEELLNQRQELEAVLLNLQNTQKQLIHSEKMASLGVLASGIAHEINNPLNFIKGGVFGIESFLNENFKDHLQELSPLLQGINEGIYRAAEIVKSLNHYNRKDDSKMLPCDIHSIIDNCLVMLRNQLKNRIEIEKSYTDKNFTLLGNEGKLHQVILNILTNAIHAIEKKGSITIISSISANNYKLQIQDTGKGIRDIHLDKILDPFFTTKPPGKGTGLGLSITHNIVQEHAGTIEFKSKPNRGTTVIITLPLKSDVHGK
ncbi:MAG: PAS domain S-box protein [Bacteroidales bacterium]|jgi:PAS domain S-box-containing protein|nr:PAS domain S-box protein [Bacteroidales bacterium]